MSSFDADITKAVPELADDDDTQAPQSQVSARDPIDERAALVNAAAEVLARSGWWGFKVESVLRQAGLSTRSFYREFDTKDDLLAAVLERDLLRIADAVEKAIAATPTLPEKFWGYVDALIGWAFDQSFAKPAALFAASLRGLRPQHSELVERCLRALTAPLVDVLQRGQRDGVMTAADPTGDARVVLTIIGASLYDSPSIDAEELREHLARIVVPFIARAFGIDPPAAGLPSLSAQ